MAVSYGDYSARVHHCPSSAALTLIVRLVSAQKSSSSTNVATSSRTLPSHYSVSMPPVRPHKSGNCWIITNLKPSQLVQNRGTLVVRMMRFSPFRLRIQLRMAISTRPSLRLYIVMLLVSSRYRFFCETCHCFLSFFYPFSFMTLPDVRSCPKRI